jgi:hypothetical protein
MRVRKAGSVNNRAAIATSATPKFGSVHVPIAPATQNPATSHVSRPSQLECAYDHDAHGGEREPVTTRLARDVQKQRGRGCEEEEDDARQCVDANMQPGRHEHDPCDERNH